MDSGDDSDCDLMSADMLENIRDGNHSHPRFNQIEARYKIRDHIRQKQLECKRGIKIYAKHG